MIGFASITPQDGLEKLGPLFHPIKTKTKTKTNRDSYANAFPRFAPWGPWNYFAFQMFHWIFLVICDWLEWQLWFCFHGTKLKSALYSAMICVPYGTLEPFMCYLCDLWFYFLLDSKINQYELKAFIECVRKLSWISSASHSNVYNELLGFSIVFSFKQVAQYLCR